MANKWNKTTLGEVLTLQRGFDLPKKSRILGKVPVIASNGPVDRHNKSKVKAPGVVIGRSGSIGGGQYITEDFWPLNTTLWVKDFKGNHKRFCYYLLLTMNLKKYNAGSGVPTLNRNHIHPLPITLPPLSEQKAIAHILGSLDDKIELNRGMNETLEAMAQALFKSWFVDFDPVIDNALAAGNEIPPEFAERAAIRESLGDECKRLPEELLSLFPAEFEQTEELGWIPKGWKAVPFNKLLHVKHGFAFKSEFFSGTQTNDIVLTPGNFHIGGGFKAEKFKYYCGQVQSEYILSDGDLLITMTDLSKKADTLGYPAFIPYSTSKRYLHNQRLGKVEIVNNSIGRALIYQYLCSDNYRNEILASMTGTTVKHTSPTKIMAHIIPFSGGLIESKYENISLDYLSKLNINNLQIESLSKLRDTLLPKLLSGELRIPEAEKLVEEAL